MRKQQAEWGAGRCGCSRWRVAFLKARRAGCLCVCVRPGRWQWHLLPPAAAAIDRKIVLFLRPATASPVSVTTDAEQTTPHRTSSTPHHTPLPESQRTLRYLVVSIYLPRPWARVTGPCAPRDPPPPGTGGRQAVTDRQVAPSRRRGKPDEHYPASLPPARNATQTQPRGARWADAAARPVTRPEGVTRHPAPPLVLIDVDP